MLGINLENPFDLINEIFFVQVFTKIALNQNHIPTSSMYVFLGKVPFLLKIKAIKQAVIITVR